MLARSSEDGAVPAIFACEQIEDRLERDQGMDDAEVAAEAGKVCLAIFRAC